MRRLFRPLLVLLALVFLLEAWLWTHLAPVVAFIVARIPLHALKAAIVAWIEKLPPAATLVAFVLPEVVLLLPLKFLEVWMLAHRNWLGAIASCLSSPWPMMLSANVCSQAGESAMSGR